MPRIRVLTVVAIAAVLAGCAVAPKEPALIERDPVDGLIAKHAANATAALRDLSEASGASRVVVANQQQAGRGAPQGRQTAIQQPYTNVEQEERRTPATSIAAARGSVPVEIESPRQAQQVPIQSAHQPPQLNVGTMVSNSGVVTSGGLLSAPPAGLERIMTVRWTGDLEQLISRIASEAGWKMGEATGLRVAPVVISINAENRSAFDILRDIGAVAGTSADIMVSAQSRTISIRYPQR